MTVINTYCTADYLTTFSKGTTTDLCFLALVTLANNIERGRGLPPPPEDSFFCEVFITRKISQVMTVHLFILFIEKFVLIPLDMCNIFLSSLCSLDRLPGIISLFLCQSCGWSPL